jgi:rhamnulokinase
VIDNPLYIAVDLGAGSGRVFLAVVAAGTFTLEEVRRFSYPAKQIGGHIRWDFPTIIAEVRAGLTDAGKRARETNGQIRSIGVDSWGVDYGLIDASGELIENPVCYRDPRTRRAMEEVLGRVPREEIFKRTGIQLLKFNTLFQLHSHASEGIPIGASQLLMIPDLVNYALTGRAVTEYTNATTTQMVSATTGTWDHDMLDRLALPSRLLGEVIPAGSDLGPLRPALADELHLEGVRVVAPATHDTGSAVAGTPLEDGWAYISSGTWSLVGVERDTPLINDEVARYNFTNEGGVFGTIRFLKNVMGLWILESCRKEWSKLGLGVDYQSLLDDSSSIGPSRALIFPDDPRFFNPPDMLAAILEQLKESGSNDPAIWNKPALIARAILDSLALRYASVVRAIESLTRSKVAGLHIVGGGSLNEYLNQATATAAGLPVRAGPVEATVIGNVLVQAIAAGRFSSHTDARRYIGERAQFKSYEPGRSREWEQAAQRYEEIERRYTKD